LRLPTSPQIYRSIVGYHIILPTKGFVRKAPVKPSKLRCLWPHFTASNPDLQDFSLFLCSQYLLAYENFADLGVLNVPDYRYVGWTTKKHTPRTTIRSVALLRYLGIFDVSERFASFSRTTQCCFQR
jgi:hypothetical protein